MCACTCASMCMISCLVCECAWTHILSCLFVVCLLVCILVYNYLLAFEHVYISSVLKCFWLYIVWLHVCGTIFAWMHACAWETCIYTYMFIRAFLCCDCIFVWIYRWVYVQEWAFVYSCVYICILVLCEW